MKPVLMLMHGREIRDCMDAFGRLQIRQAWFTGYTEKELESAIAGYIGRTDYTHYVIASDDLIPTQSAMEEVLRGLEDFDAVTGWSNIYPGSARANIRLKEPWGSKALFMLGHPLSGLIPSQVTMAKSKTFADANAIIRQERFFRTYYMGFSFTGMTRDLWLRFPLRTFGESGSDYSLSARLNGAGVPMWCARDGFFRHLKSMENFIVGKVPKKVEER